MQRRATIACGLRPPTPDGDQLTQHCQCAGVVTKAGGFVQRRLAAVIDCTRQAPPRTCSGDAMLFVVLRGAWLVCMVCVWVAWSTHGGGDGARVGRKVWEGGGASE